MQVKIQRTTKELRPLRGGPPNGPLYTGLLIDGNWFNIEGDHRNLYNKTVDLVFDGNNIAKFATQQTPPAQHQTPPQKSAPTPITNGHTPRWPDREAVVEAYAYYITRIGEYVQDPAAAVRAANMLIGMEERGEVNPVHREGGAPF